MHRSFSHHSVALNETRVVDASHCSSPHSSFGRSLVESVVAVFPGGGVGSDGDWKDDGDARLSWESMICVLQ